MSSSGIFASGRFRARSAARVLGAVGAALLAAGCSATLAGGGPRGAPADVSLGGLARSLEVAFVKAAVSDLSFTEASFEFRVRASNRGGMEAEALSAEYALLLDDVEAARGEMRGLGPIPAGGSAEFSARARAPTGAFSGGEARWRVEVLLKARIGPYDGLEYRRSREGRVSAPLGPAVSLESLTAHAGSETARLRIRVENRSRSLLELVGARIRVRLGEGKRESFRWTESRELFSGGSTVLDIPVRLEYGSEAASALFREGEAPFSADGTLIMRTPFPLMEQVQIPFELSGAVPVESPLQ